MQSDKNIYSHRGQEWIEFMWEVLDHVEDYTIKQYGDKGEDLLTEMTAEECILQIKQYCARFGRQGREGQQLLDMKKIAHYACIIWHKLKEESDANELSDMRKADP